MDLNKLSIAVSPGINMILSNLIPIPKKQESFENDRCYKNDENLPILILFGLINIGISVYAGYLAWKCYAKSDNTWRIIRTVLAFLYGWLYIVFHVIFMVPLCGVMKN